MVTLLNDEGLNLKLQGARQLGFAVCLNPPPPNEAGLCRIKWVVYATRGGAVAIGERAHFNDGEEEHRAVVVHDVQELRSWFAQKTSGKLVHGSKYLHQLIAEHLGLEAAEVVS